MSDTVRASGSIRPSISGWCRHPPWRVKSSIPAARQPLCDSVSIWPHTLRISTTGRTTQKSGRGVRRSSPMARADSRSPPNSNATGGRGRHDHGYAEVQLQPGQQPGELKLKSWSRIEGRFSMRANPSRQPGSALAGAPPQWRLSPYPGSVLGEDGQGRPVCVHAGASGQVARTGAALRVGRLSVQLERVRSPRPSAWAKSSG